MPVRLPSYIYRNRCGIFYFRVVLPSALATADAQREFRVSLHTPERELAVSTARYLAYRVGELLAALIEMAKRKHATLGTPSGFAADQFRSWLGLVRDKFRALEKVEELEQIIDSERAAHRKALAEQLEQARTVVQRAYAQGIVKGSKIATPTLRCPP